MSDPEINQRNILGYRIDKPPEPPTESPNKISRRNILAVLGVAAVSTPALAAEHIESSELMKGAPHSVLGIALASPETQERFAKALENAAAAIRSREMCCMQMDINSTVKINEWMEHKVTFTFELGMPKAQTS